MSQKSIEELLIIAKKEREQSQFAPRTFQRTEDGTILLDPQNQSDRDWLENPVFDNLVDG